MRIIFRQQKLIPLLTFNPGLALTGFRTTRSWTLRFILKYISFLFPKYPHVFWSVVAKNHWHSGQSPKPELEMILVWVWLWAPYWLLNIFVELAIAVVNAGSLTEVAIHGATTKGIVASSSGRLCAYGHSTWLRDHRKWNSLSNAGSYHKKCFARVWYWPK